MVLLLVRDYMNQCLHCFCSCAGWLIARSRTVYGCVECRVPSHLHFIITLRISNKGKHNVRPHSNVHRKRYKLIYLLFFLPLFFASLYSAALAIKFIWCRCARASNFNLFVWSAILGVCTTTSPKKKQQQVDKWYDKLDIRRRRHW